MDRTMGEQGAFTAVLAQAAEAQARENQRLREALTKTRESLLLAQQEASHGKTASATFIDGCVVDALGVLDAVLA